MQVATRIDQGNRMIASIRYVYMIASPERVTANTFSKHYAGVLYEGSQQVYRQATARNAGEIGFMPKG